MSERLLIHSLHPGPFSSPVLRRVESNVRLGGRRTGSIGEASDTAESLDHRAPHPLIWAAAVDDAKTILAMREELFSLSD